MLMEVGFTNPTMGQTLFYQLNLYKYPSPAGAGFFANTNPYGYRDVMANYGQSPLTPGVVSDFTGTNALDLAARVCTVISNATNGMDTNCADWYTDGAYHGG